jgi:pimeloyl-ACP methyl ester carboxylesterase
MAGFVAHSAVLIAFKRGADMTIAALLLPLAILADGPADNSPDRVRPVPKPGIEVPAADRAELERGLAELREAAGELSQKTDRLTADLVPDVQIYLKAVGDALEYGEFFQEGEIAKAKALLEEGRARAAQLKAGTAPWAGQSGLLARGYVSRIDRSVQPYGLVVPASWSPAGKERFRLDIWFHGRDEVLSEVNFLDQRRRQAGTFTPPDAFVLHPYGRYCNAFKFAGEVDVLEALRSVEERYRIDPDRVSVRGFSMGGAAAWHFAVHYADRWFAANPGAGFAETPEFLRIFQKESLGPAGYERKLWHLYDATDYALNLIHCPTVAYSGELDTQKQAADIMARALGEEGIDLQHVIGPGTKHQYHPQAQATVERLMSDLGARGRERLPRSLHFTTFTLKYNRLHWLTVDALGEHWKRARVDARLRGEEGLELRTANVSALTLNFPAGTSSFDLRSPVLIDADGELISAGRPKSDRSWSASLHREEGRWRLGPREGTGPRKTHDLQGPIDDAFMDSFLFVRPTGKAANPQVEKWVRDELELALSRWRRQFRGRCPVKDDAAVGEEDIASSHLVLWGDPSMNSVLSRIAERLPIRWNGEGIAVADRRYPADRHALILIYPNPLNPRRYVVLNSGFTYRAYDDLNNARQVPKLPDWAVIDLATPPGSRAPGRVAAADFFGEEWELRAPAAPAGG